MAVGEVLVCLTAVGLTVGVPIWCQDCPEDMKRDVWVSRGWGASGLPFNYIDQRARQGPSRVSGPEAPEAQLLEATGGEPSAQFLTARLVSEGERYPAVPQLFVSYGWGPLGK
nr:uncharacterized protein LOC106679538 [Halyomorpha halys]